ncbi:MFS general substrate transporter [Crassisporium funariophilum]|nr:MFS general substrate transporter [Crassisporium funariophilum]
MAPPQPQKIPATTEIPSESSSISNSSAEKSRRNVDAENAFSERGSFSSDDAADGGVDAWVTIFGAWLILFATFGYLYSFGVYQDYYTRYFLSHHSPSKIAWIGSFQLMMPFALGIVSGKLFDAGYFHALEITGSSIFALSLFMLSLAEPQQYYQVFLSQGLGMGLGLGLTFIPTASIAHHHFQRRKSLAIGVALSGNSAGAIVFPIMINQLIPKIGFAETVRASGYIVLGCLLLGNCLVRTAYKRNASDKPKLDIKSFFSDAPYLWTILGALVSTLGFYFPLIYLQLYAAQHHIDSSLAFYSIAILNASSAVGRVAGNHLADLYGPINLIVPCSFITGGTIFAVLGVNSVGSLVVVSVMYGIFAGAWLSLAMAGLGSLARHPGEVGARAGLALALSSFGSLGAAPVQGALLTDQFLWTKPIAFSGTLMVASALVSRHLLAKERGTQRV